MAGRVYCPKASHQIKAISPNRIVASNVAVSMIVYMYFGGDLLSHIIVVPSALRNLTSLFGMGRGYYPRYNHREDFSFYSYFSILYSGFTSESPSSLSIFFIYLLHEAICSAFSL